MMARTRVINRTAMAGSVWYWNARSEVRRKRRAKKAARRPRARRVREVAVRRRVTRIGCGGWDTISVCVRLNFGDSGLSLLRRSPRWK